MKLSEVINVLKEMDQVQFILPNGTHVPAHFHITEVGRITREFIDCGGQLRKENHINFQLWEADDFDHRLGASKLLGIIHKAQQVIELKDEEVEVEYQGNSIERYNLEFEGSVFRLRAKATNCLAPDKCGIPKEKLRVNIAELNNAVSCKPGSGCC